MPVIPTPEQAAEYLGNAIHDIERALKDGKLGITLNRQQMGQILSENAAMVEKVNQLVRENNALVGEST